MNSRNVFFGVLGTVILSTLTTSTSAQVTDAAARDQASSAVRAQLHFKPEKFLSVQRNEELEQSLAMAVGRAGMPAFIYRVSQEGFEIKGNTILHYLVVGYDQTKIIAVGSKEGRVYRIHGFSDSMDEFGKLMRANNVKVLNPGRAEAVAEFFRTVNPQNYSLDPLYSLIELKQTAERQCHKPPNPCSMNSCC